MYVYCELWDAIVSTAMTKLKLTFFTLQQKWKYNPVATGRQGKDIGDVKFNSDGDGMGRYRLDLKISKSIKIQVKNR